MLCIYSADNLKAVNRRHSTAIFSIFKKYSVTSQIFYRDYLTAQPISATSEVGGISPMGTKSLWWKDLWIMCR